MDEFKQVAKEVHMDEDTFHDLAVLKEWSERAEYPERTYKHLFGFKTWKPEHTISTTHYNNATGFDGVRDLYNKIEEELEKAERDFSTGGLGFFCNIERFGIPYGTDPELILEFFTRISEATEPFVVWHSAKEHDFTDLHDMDLHDIESEVVYRIECRDGEGTIHKIEYEKTGEEQIIDFTADEGDTGGA